ncbi:hypothetical protein [Amycolatopsis magusensis]|uniref:Uncharacterized protein n=1 Tax=Amycolatopsis magusensis TaxID=882444 RepID=A0ABS4PIK2_9PSEU|nr:hypothetical protein [Amycolatopsis magusensis]MBP2179253.1 hypothetical protein [Amycolatopsis magusensis]
MHHRRHHRHLGPIPLLLPLALLTWVPLTLLPRLALSLLARVALLSRLALALPILAWVLLAQQTQLSRVPLTLLPGLALPLAARVTLLVPVALLPRLALRILLAALEPLALVARLTRAPLLARLVLVALLLTLAALATGLSWVALASRTLRTPLLLLTRLLLVARRALPARVVLLVRVVLAALLAPRPALPLGAWVPVLRLTLLALIVLRRLVLRVPLPRRPAVAPRLLLLPGVRQGGGLLRPLPYGCLLTRVLLSLFSGPLRRLLLRLRIGGRLEQRALRFQVLHRLGGLWVRLRPRPPHPQGVLLRERLGSVVVVRRPPRLVGPAAVRHAPSSGVPQLTPRTHRCGSVVTRGPH